MTDKYEEFKDWVMERITISTKFEILHNLFREFEEEQAEKEKEEDIKMIISRIMYCESFYYISIKQQTKVNEIYDELKEKDLIK